MDTNENRTQWHPKFCTAMQLELYDNRKDLEYHTFYCRSFRKNQTFKRRHSTNFRQTAEMTYPNRYSIYITIFMEEGLLYVSNQF